MAHFYIKAGTQAGRSIEIQPTMLPGYHFPVFVIGSDPRCHLVLKDPGIAPVHALLAYNKTGDLVMKAYQPDEIITLNGKAISTGVLRDNSILKLGQVTLDFSTSEIRKAAPLFAEPPVVAHISKAKNAPRKGFQLNSTVIFCLIAALSMIIPIVITMSHVKQGLDIVLGYRDSPADRATLIEIAPRENRTYRQNIMVANPNKLALLYFKADWCVYCRSQSPVIDRLQNYYREIMGAKVIDVDDPSNFDLVYAYDVRSLPRLVLIDDQGNMLNTFYGFTQEQVLSRSIEQAYYQ